MIHQPLLCILSLCFIALCFLSNNLPVASSPHPFCLSSSCFSGQFTFMPLCCTDPACSGEKQSDPALLSEAGPAAAPRPGHKHRRTGSTRLRALTSMCVCKCFMCVCVRSRNTPPPVCFQGDGAPLRACPAAGVCVTRRRRDGRDSSC